MIKNENLFHLNFKERLIGGTERQRLWTEKQDIKHNPQSTGGPYFSSADNQKLMIDLKKITVNSWVANLLLLYVNPKEDS